MKKREFAEYDPDADALYVGLLDGDIEKTTNLGDLRLIDYSAKGEVLGVEFLNVSDGVDLSDVPQASVIDRIIANSGYHFRVHA